MDSVLVTGANGQLGAEFKSFLSDKVKLLALGSKELNIADPKEVENVLKSFKPQVLINCAAYTKVDEAETESGKKQANLVNNKAVGSLVRLCNRHDIKLVHFSTDYVFDGEKPLGSAYSEDDTPRPINEYGVSKLLGDNEVLSESQGGLVIRVAWLTGVYGHNYVNAIINRAKQSKQLKVVDDQVGTPSFCSDVVEKTWALININSEGLFNICSKDACNRMEFTQEILRYLNLNKDVNIEAVKTSSFASLANRPLNTALSLEKIQDEINIIPKDWKTLLHQYLKNLK
jgi:dTDP-4-dehydrorhamnose reductase